MKKLILVPFLFLTFGLLSKAQEVYTTTNGEWIFSLASVEYDSEEAHDVLRWSPLINFYQHWHFDLNENLGFMAGLGTHNIGFITDVPSSQGNGGTSYNGDVRKKFRNYTLGIPIGLKVGLMKSMYLYGGYEIEFPYHYKEKTFVDGHKESKYTKWFAQQTPDYYNSFFVGVQFAGGTSLKFHYYTSDFFNQDYLKNFTPTDGRNFYPTKANMFYFSISQTILKGKEVVKYAPSSSQSSRAALRLRVF